MRPAGFFRGATCWEGWLGPVWFRWPFPRFWIVGVRPSAGFDFGLRFQSICLMLVILASGIVWGN